MASNAILCANLMASGLSKLQTPDTFSPHGALTHRHAVRTQLPGELAMMELLTRFRRPKSSVVDSARPTGKQRGAAAVSNTPDLDVRKFGAITVVEFLDRRIVDQEHVSRIGGQIRSLVNAGENPGILLDFQRVEFLSSATLSELLNIEKLVRSKNGKLRLMNLDRNLKKMFSMTKLDKVLKICKDNEQAVKSFE